MERKAKTIKEFLKAMLWMYENTLEWTQGSKFKNKKSEIILDITKETPHSACLVGCACLVDIDYDSDLRNNVYSKIRSHLNLPFGGIPAWNDSNKTKKEDVIRLLKNLIKKCN